MARRLIAHRRDGSTFVLPTRYTPRHSADWSPTPAQAAEEVLGHEEAGR